MFILKRLGQALDVACLDASNMAKIAVWGRRKEKLPLSLSLSLSFLVFGIQFLKMFSSYEKFYFERV